MGKEEPSREIGPGKCQRGLMNLGPTQSNLEGGNKPFPGAFGPQRMIKGINPRTFVWTQGWKPRQLNCNLDPLQKESKDTRAQWVKIEIVTHQMELLVDIKS